MIRILSITYKDSTAGGPYRVAIDHKNSLEKENFNIKFFNNKTNLLSAYIFNNKRIKKFFNKFDLIHVHNLFSVHSMLILKIAELLSIPSVLTVHGNLNVWSMKKNYIIKILFLNFFKKNINSVSLIHFLNYQEKKEASKYVNVKQIPFTINQNCINVSNFKIKRTKESFFNILFFGRLDEKKNFLKIPEIANIFKINSVNDVKFIIVGPGKKKNIEQLKDKVRELKLDNLVEIRNSISSTDQKNALFSEIDVFILPSEDEADSVAIKEALASGKPVVISKECKFISDDKNEEFIKIINDKSAQSYYFELIKFYKKREELKNLGFKIHSYSKENFSTDLLTKWLTVIYKDCVNHTHSLNNK